MSDVLDDLKFALLTRVAVELTLLNGEHLWTGVESVDDDDRTVSLWAPKVFGDTTRRSIRADDIVSWTVTEVEYPPPPA